jgi:hypothetical protein
MALCSGFLSCESTPAGRAAVQIDRRAPPYVTSCSMSHF